eukprot:scaffold102988_cov15-Prasinocladus_malaysianus.AAC.1
MAECRDDDTYIEWVSHILQSWPPGEKRTSLCDSALAVTMSFAPHQQASMRACLTITLAEQSRAGTLKPESPLSPRVLLIDPLPTKPR